MAFGSRKSMLSGIAADAQAEMLFRGWCPKFRAQDLSLKWTGVEKAYFKVIPHHEAEWPGTTHIVLCGVVDGEGPDWFGDWKTANPREKKYWKKSWLLSTQALTYGLLTGGERRYLVRKAFKEDPPTFDHEWFAFDPRDLEQWERQLHLIAHDILTYRKQGIESPWQQNFEHGCFAYGQNYPCPLWQDGCTQQNYDGAIPGALPFEFFAEFTGENRVQLLTLRDAYPNALFLSASRIKYWQRCQELYRRSEQMKFPTSEAMSIGTSFHSLVADYNIRNYLITGSSYMGITEFLTAEMREARIKELLDSRKFWFGGSVIPPLPYDGLRITRIPIEEKK